MLSKTQQLYLSLKQKREMVVDLKNKYDDAAKKYNSSTGAVGSVKKQDCQSSRLSRSLSPSKHLNLQNFKASNGWLEYVFRARSEVALHAML